MRTNIEEEGGADRLHARPTYACHAYVPWPLERIQTRGSLKLVLAASRMTVVAVYGFFDFALHESFHLSFSSLPIYLFAVLHAGSRPCVRARVGGKGAIESDDSYTATRRCVPESGSWSFVIRVLYVSEMYSCAVCHVVLSSGILA